MNHQPLKMTALRSVETLQTTDPTTYYKIHEYSNFEFHNIFWNFFRFTQLLKMDLDDWLTVHRSITLVDLQLDAQNSYLFTYNTFIKILYMFRALPCSSSGGLHRNCIYVQPAVSSLSAGDCPVHRLRKKVLS